MAGAAAIVDLVYEKKIQCFRLAISGIVPAVQGRLIAVANALASCHIRPTPLPYGESTMTSTAAYLRSPWQIELRHIDLPAQPRPGWVRLRVDACGLCGTDLSAACPR